MITVLTTTSMWSIQKRENIFVDKQGFKKKEERMEPIRITVHVDQVKKR